MEFGGCHKGIGEVERIQVERGHRMLCELVSMCRSQSTGNKVR